jgi:hypothetical protein
MKDPTTVTITLVFINYFRFIHDFVSFFPSFLARHDSTERRGKSIAGTTSRTTTIDGAVTDEPERFEFEQNIQNY